MGKLVHKRKDYTGVSPYKFVPITEADYNALTPAEQEDETKMYWIYDVDTVSADIDDESVSSGKVWSSEKVSSEISDVQDQVDTNTDDIGTLNTAIAGNKFLNPDSGWIMNNDANNITDTGIYNMGTGNSNLPQSWTILLVIKGRSDAIRQFAMGTSGFYFRGYQNNTWSSWVLID